MKDKDLESLCEMLASSDPDSVYLAAGIINEHLDEFSKTELRALALLFRLRSQHKKTMWGHISHLETNETKFVIYVDNRIFTVLGYYSGILTF